MFGDGIARNSVEFGVLGGISLFRWSLDFGVLVFDLVFLLASPPLLCLSVSGTSETVFA